MKNYIIVGICLLLTGLTTGCKDNSNQNLVGDLTIEFEHVWNDETVAFFLDSNFIHPKSHDTLAISKLQFYISNIVLVKTDGTICKEENSYHLVNPSDYVLSIKNLPKGEYRSVSFTIGIDSQHNCSCQQTGDLDPQKGMFNDWTKGYTFIQVVGRANSNLPFNYALGGCTSNCNCIRNLSFNFPVESLYIRPNAVPEIHMMLKVANLWDDGISIKTKPQISILESGSTHKTDLFSAGLTLEHIHNN